MLMLMLMLMNSKLLSEILGVEVDQKCHNPLEHR